MIEIATDFPYLGTRDYIHGTSLLAGFIDALERHGERPVTVKRLKFQKPARTNGRMVVSTEPLSSEDTACANCTFLASAGDRIWRGFYAENGTVVKRRIDADYPIAKLESCAFGGCCTIAPQDRDDLIRTFVEANKRFHEAAVENPSAIRFGYIEAWEAPPQDVRFEGPLEATNLIAKKNDDGYMTINRLAYSNARGERATLTLCFNVIGGAQRR